MKQKDQHALYLGLLICAGILGMFAVTLFYPKEENKGKQELRVAFTNIGGANKGMNVCLAGKVIGTVSDIHNIMDQGLADEQDQLYCYELVLKIDSNISVYQGDRILLHSPKLITEPVINIVPSKNRTNTQRLTFSSLAYGHSIDPVEKIMHFIDKAEDSITYLHNEIALFINNISILLKNEDEVSIVKTTLDAISSIQKGVDQLSGILDRSSQIEQLLADCGEVAAAVKDYGLLYHCSSQWKRAQKSQGKQNISSEKSKN